MRTQILLDDALEEIIKRAEKITDTRFIDIQDAGGCRLAEDLSLIHILRKKQL